MLNTSLINGYVNQQNEQLMAKAKTEVLKTTLNFNTQLMETLIEKMSGINQNLNNNPSNTGIFLDIRV
jgi:hypothetical protein